MAATIQTNVDYTGYRELVQILSSDALLVIIKDCKEALATMYKENCRADSVRKTLVINAIFYCAMELQIRKQAS